jgi:hypothetical protein
VVVDYTSLFGGEVQKQKPDDLVGGWRKLLTPLPATQHLLGPIEVAVKGGAATAACHVRGYHHRKGTLAATSGWLQGTTSSTWSRRDRNGGSLG